MKNTAFKASFFIRNPILQAILGGRCPKSHEPSRTSILLAETIDNSGDKLAILVGDENVESDKIALIVPGLGSSASAPLVRRLARSLEDGGYRVFRMNHRGVGVGANCARGIYHGGRSDDFVATIRTVISANPARKIDVVSMSMGSNIALKAFGEPNAILDSSWTASVRCHIALSPVINLKESAQAIGKIGFGFFQHVFGKSINRYCMKRHRLHKELGDFVPIKPFSLTAFDEQYTAPQAGFSSAADYYARSSSQSLLNSITTPTVCVYSQDDDVEPLKNFPSTTYLRSIVTEHGGHLGFVCSINYSRPNFWLDDIMMDVLNSEHYCK